MKLIKKDVENIIKNLPRSMQLGSSKTLYSEGRYSIQVDAGETDAGTFRYEYYFGSGDVRILAGYGSRRDPAPAETIRRLMTVWNAFADYATAYSAG